MAWHSMLDLSNALPCGLRAQDLKHQLSSKLLNSLKHLTEVCSEFIVIDKNIGDINKNSPFLYGLNSELIESVQKNDLDQVRVCANSLNSLVVHLDMPLFLNFGTGQVPKDLEILFVKNATATVQFLKNVTVRTASRYRYEKTIKMIQEALLVLKKIDLEIYKENFHFVSHYLLLDSNRLTTGSSFNFFGLIFIKAFDDKQSFLEMIDLLVHETAHHYIFALSVFDELVLNPPEELYKSPLRKDPRPMIGNYHALFVLTRLIYILRKVKDRAAEFNIAVSEVDAKLENYLVRFEDGYALLEAQAKLTTLGRDLMHSCFEIVNGEPSTTLLSAKKAVSF